MKTNVKYIATDDHGNTKMIRSDHPRKELEAIYCGKVSKMYVDDNDGNTQHVGYVIGNNWITLYKIEGVGL